MSSNRLIYDVETFNEYTDANAKHLAYTEYKGNFVNDSRCGTEMPLGDRAKIENMLTEADRKASKAVGSVYKKIYSKMMEKHKNGLFYTRCL